MDINQFKQMVQYSAQNPTSDNAVEFGRRIQEGRYNDVLSGAGLNPAQFGYKAPAPTSTQTEEPGLLQSVGSSLASSEIGFGKSLAGAAQTMGVGGIDKSYEQSLSGLKNSQDQLIQRIKSNEQQGKDTTRLKNALRSTSEAMQHTTEEYAQSNPLAAKTWQQVLGEAGGVALDIGTAGVLAKGAKGFQLIKGAETAVKGATEAEKVLTTGQKLAQVAKATGKNILKGGALGYGYDVTGKLQEGKTGTEALTPGMGTVTGMAIPTVFGLWNAGKIAAPLVGSRIDNSLIKPLPKDFRYGKNPGKTMAEMGITGNSMEDLQKNVSNARQSIGEQIGAIHDKIPEVKFDATSTLDPINKAMQEAASHNDTTLMQRLVDIKKAITEKLVPVTSKEGATTITSQGTRDLSNISNKDAQEIKQLIGDMTKWTGNATDDKVANKALKQVYGGISDLSLKESKKVAPGLVPQLEKLNQKYGDLSTAEIAIRHRAELMQGKDLISMPIKMGGAAGILTAISTGGAAIPAILAATGAAALDKALQSTPVKTRIASWLAKESPSVIEKFYAKHPDIANVIQKTFSKEY